MKKIIALLATFALILAVAPMSFAASVNYVVDLGDAVAVNGVNVYPITVKVSGMTNPATAGMLTLKWDTTKVQPYYNFNGMMAGAIDSSNWGSFGSMHYVATGISIDATNGIYASNLADGYYAFDWYSTTGLANDTVFLTLNFGLVGTTTTADFDANTFTLVSEAEEATLGNVAANIANNGSNFISDGSTVSNSKAGTCGVVFNTYTKTETSWKDTVVDSKPSDATDDGSKFTFPTATKADANDTSVDTGKSEDVVRQIVVFAKAPEALTANTYGIKMGEFFYPGLLDVAKDSYWSIILMTNEDNNGLTKDSYSYQAMIKTDALGTVTEGTTEVSEAKTVNFN